MVGERDQNGAIAPVLFEDSAALLGLVTALFGLWLSHVLALPVLDGIASVLIGLILAGTAAFLAWECQSLLTGEAAALEVRGGIRRTIDDEPGVVRPNEILTMHFGLQDVVAALSLKFDHHRPAADVEAAVPRIGRTIKADHPEVTRVFVEAQRTEAHRRAQQAVLPD